MCPRNQLSPAAPSRPEASALHARGLYALNLEFSDPRYLTGFYYFFKLLPLNGFFFKESFGNFIQQDSSVFQYFLGSNLSIFNEIRYFCVNLGGYFFGIISLFPELFS